MAPEPTVDDGVMIDLVLRALDALPQHVAVLDGTGAIVAVNEAWRRFGRANGAAVEIGPGADYLAACDRGAAAGEEAAAEAATGIRDLLAGARGGFAVRYPCHAPGEERWFEATGTAFDLDGRRYVVLAHREVTERKRAEDALAASEERLRQVLEILPVGVWLVDAAGRIVHGNPAGRRIWAGARYVGPEGFGEYKGWWRSTGRPIAAGEWAAARAIRDGEVSIDEEIEIECFDGSRKVILNSALPLRGAGGAIAGAIIVNQDVTERVQMAADLEAANRDLRRALAEQEVLARTDHLTGVHLRRHFYELAAHELAVAQRYGQPLAVVLLDVDRFKRVNDRFGHHAGDEVLRRVAAVARRTLREADVFARHGGEEFVALLPHTDLAAATAAAEHLRRAIAAERVATPRGTIAVTLSAGAAEARPGDSVDDLVRRADEALYRAKAAGRNRVAAAEGGR